MLSRSISLPSSPHHPLRFTPYFPTLTLASSSSSLLSSPQENTALQPGKSPHTTAVELPSIEGLRFRPKSYNAGSHVSPSFCSYVLKLCSRMGSLSQGEQVHCQMIKLGYHRQIALQNHLLNVCVKCGCLLTSALRLFDEIPVKNVVSWNTMISGSVGLKLDTDGNSIIKSVPAKNLGLRFFKGMLVTVVEPDRITLVGVLGCCISMDSLDTGKQLHCFIIKFGHSSDGFVGGSIVDLYAKCGLVEDACSAFDEIHTRDLVLWNVMVSCYALNGLGKEAFLVFKSMCSECVVADRYTFCSLVNASSCLGCIVLGRQIHGLITRLSSDLDAFTGSALIDMYAKTGTMEDAHKLFDLMKVKNIVSWNAIVVGYGRNAEGGKQMNLFRQMLQGGLKPDELTLASIFSSCANSAVANEVIEVHACAVKHGLEAFLSVGNALISAYAKCGNICDAYKSFSLISKPDTVTWTSLICGYAFHGLVNEALKSFEEMLSKGLQPDGIAFLGVLCACTHAGLVDSGLRYFTSMVKDHQISPNSEHYSCLVDLLGRAGCIDEVSNILAYIPFKRSANVLGAVLGACKVHMNTRLGKWAADMLFSLQPNESVNYMLMSNIFAGTGCWEDVARVRKMMRNNCPEKLPGCSWIEIGSRVHIFVSNDKSHPKALAVCAMLHMHTRLMKFG